MEDLLTNAGLTKAEAQAYLYLLQNGPSFPVRLAESLKLTRTNAYKVLGSLEEAGLVTRDVEAKKIVFTAEDPIALASLVAEKRNAIIALEKSVDTAMQQLRRNFMRSHTNEMVHMSRGREAILDAYEHQAQLQQPIYFIATRADRPFLGFEAIHKVRVEQGMLSPDRFGITPDAPEAPINPELDKATKLTRTWINEKDYTAPVEWSVSGGSLIAQVFDGDGRTIIIKDELIAESFQQLWRLLDTKIRSVEGYATLPLKATRAI